MRYRAIHNELFKQLGNQDPNVRVAAAYSLGKMKVRRGIKHLARALQDHIPEIRCHAAWALGMIRDPKAFIYLKLAKLDNNKEVQDAIQHALSRLALPTTDSLIQTLIKHPNPQKRSQAAKSLGILCESQTLETLVYALKDPSLQVRLESIQAIGYLHFNGDHNLLKKIIASLNDESSVMRRHVILAIRHLLTHSTPMQEHDTTKMALTAMSHNGQQAWTEITAKPQNLEIRHVVKKLLDCLRNEPNPSVQVEAARTLGHLLGHSMVPEPRWNKSRPTVLQLKQRRQDNSSDGPERKPTSLVAFRRGGTGAL